MALNKLYNDVVSYFWTENDDKSKTDITETEEMPHITRINRLHSLLKDTNYT